MKILSVTHFALLASLFTFLLTACKSEQANQPNLQEEVTTEVNTLEPGKSLKEYMNTIFITGRNLSKKSDNIVKKYGENSPEHLAMKKERLAVDKRNDMVVDAILKKFGYPTNQEYGPVVSMVPWLVIHQSESLELKEKHFDLIHNAYKNGDIDGNSFSMYLNSLFILQNGKNFSMNKTSFSIEEEIEALVAAIKK